MSLLDGLLGGVVGGEMATVVNGFIEHHGGAQGIVAQMEQQGLGNTVKSWVGPGANLPISPDQVHAVFGAAAQQAARIRSTPGNWQQFTTQPYNGQPSNYTDPFWSNVGAGFSLVGGRVTALATTPDGA